MKRPDHHSTPPNSKETPPVTGGAATISDVARLSGVSVGTVSNVLNNRTKHIRPEMRGRVLDAARQLNYRPNGVARGLVQRRTRTLGVLFHASSAIITLDPYASAVLHGILMGTSAFGYSVLLYPQPLTNREKDVHMVADGRADGILVVAPEQGDETLAALIAMDIPVALVSARWEGNGNVVSVDVDNYAGAYRATEHLLSLGHRKIAHLTGSLKQQSAHDRETGFRTAMADAGVRVREDFVVACGYHGGEAYEPTRRLLALPDPPTALFCANDNLAVGAALAARDAEVSLPDSLSLVGFDDAPAAVLITPQLTTIRQPLAEIGRRAAELLIGRLADGPSAAPGQALLFEPTLVVRGSTVGPPSQQL